MLEQIGQIGNYTAFVKPLTQRPNDYDDYRTLVDLANLPEQSSRMNVSLAPAQEFLDAIVNDLAGMNEDKRYGHLTIKTSSDGTLNGGWHTDGGDPNFLSGLPLKLMWVVASSKSTEFENEPEIPPLTIVRCNPNTDIHRTPKTPHHRRFMRFILLD